MTLTIGQAQAAGLLPAIGAVTYTAADFWATRIQHELEYYRNT